MNEKRLRRKSAADFEGTEHHWASVGVPDDAAVEEEAGTSLQFAQVLLNGLGK